MLDFITSTRDRVLKGEDISAGDALRLLDAKGADFLDLLAAANRVRDHFRGDEVSFCSVLNAKSGGCTEDCSFCSQSAHHSTHVPESPLASADEMLAASDRAADAGAHSFGIVTSGRGLDAGEFETVLKAVRLIKEKGRLHVDGSIGIVSLEQAVRLKDAGVRRLHHNLESARSFYGEICTTRDYEDNVEAVRTIKKSGLDVCSGGIFGMGESKAQRVEMLVELRDLEVEGLPLNFLVPIVGTALGRAEPISPLDALASVAVARLLLPRSDVRVCGGREVVLGDLQCMIYFAGASGTMIGDYLTTRGRAVEEDHALIGKLGLER